VKTRFLRDALSQRRRGRALTILEMLVSTALLSFIVLGLTAMLIQTQKAFKMGIKQANITDAGRAVMDMITSDLSQMSDPRFTNLCYPLGVSPSPNLNWARVARYDLYQYNNGIPFRTNQIQDIFAVVQTNATWMGIGYAVSNWFTNSGGGSIAGVGTLYRYFASTNGPLSTNNNLFSTFNFELGLGTFTNTYFHRIADGVVHLKIYAYDADGNEMPYEPTYDQSGSYNGYTFLQYPYVTNYLGQPYVTNYLPHSIDIELGILEPEAFETARSLYTSGAITAASNYLANAAGQVEIFRQHIIIPAAP
jgi:hypothetical protein